jgi:hypothetical protein
MIGRFRQLFDQRRYALAVTRGLAAGISEPAGRCSLITASGDRSRIVDTAAPSSALLLPRSTGRPVSLLLLYSWVMGSAVAIRDG